MNPRILTAVKSYGKSLLAVILGLFLASGADVFAVSLSDLKAWLAAGLAAVLPVVITALDPTDTRYGIGARSTARPVMAVKPAIKPRSKS